MPPKRKKNPDYSDAEVDVNEDESTVPKKRGRKSLIDAILEEEGTVTSCCGFLPGT